MPPSQNALISGLGEDALIRLGRKVRPVRFRSKEVLYRAGDRISDIYFPDSGVICMLTIMDDGRSVESATVGNEGASWVSASFGTPTMPCQTMVVVEGTGVRIAAKYVEEEIRRNGQFHDVLTAYSHALLISALRIGSCNTLHSLPQRCARWALMTLDRCDENQFAITHEFLASLLGCNRAVLTTVLGKLEEEGGIHLRRGHIELADRAKLEHSSCECFQVIRETFAREARLGTA